MRWSLWNRSLYGQGSNLHLLGYVLVTKDKHVPLAVKIFDGYQRAIFPFCSCIPFLWSVKKKYCPIMAWYLKESCFTQSTVNMKVIFQFFKGHGYLKIEVFY